MIRALPFVFMLACSVEPSNMAGFLGPQAQLEDDDAVAEAFLATLLPLALPHEAGRHHDDACPIRTEWEGGFALDGGCTTVDGARFVGSYVEEKLDSTTTFIRYEAWEAHGRDPAEARVGSCTHAFVARDSQAARRHWFPHYDHYLRWANDLLKRQHHPVDLQWSAETFIDQVAICGSPAEVVDRIGHFRESLGSERHLLMFDPGGLPEADLRDCIELVGKEVIPALAN